MTLSCSCDFDQEDYDKWFWMDHSGWHPIESKKRKRCCSCKSLIEHSEDTLEFYRYRDPRSDVEERIHGEMVTLASWYMCEVCSGLYMALEDLGFNCIDISVPMKETIAEYNDLRKEALT